MNSKNIVIIEGRTGKEAVTRYTQDGKPVTSFQVATSEKKGEQEYTTWHDVVAFGKVAEILVGLEKGTHVIVMGSINKRSYDDKNGNKIWSTNIVASTVFCQQRIKFGENKQVPESEDLPF